MQSLLFFFVSLHNVVFLMLLNVLELFVLNEVIVVRFEWRRCGICYMDNMYEFILQMLTKLNALILACKLWIR